MIQKISNAIAIRIPTVDLTAVTDIEVTFDQKASGVEFTYSGDDVVVMSEHMLAVRIPKKDAMEFLNKNIRGQVMFTNAAGVPLATKVFSTNVAELLKEDGYGQ